MLITIHSPANLKTSSIVGGKAANLFTLADIKSQYVPDFVALSFEKVSGSLRDYCHDYLKTLFLDEKWSKSKLAVRSSGIDEDGIDHSFAGMFETYLGVIGLEQTIDAIEKCVESTKSERVRTYYKKKGLNKEAAKMSVVIQILVESEKSGVAFSMHPLLPWNDLLLVEAVRGLGEGLVSGSLNSDKYEIQRTNKSVSSTLSNEDFFFQYNLQEKKVTKEKVAEEIKNLPVLSKEEILHIFNECLYLEKHFNHAVDIEWAMANGSFYLLQVRPITSFPPLKLINTINKAPYFLWDNSNIVESFTGVVSPLTFTATQKAYSQVYYLTAKLMGVPDYILEQMTYSLNHLIGHVEGRVYYNLLHWYELLELLPGGKKNRALMETMMGVKEKVSGESVVKNFKIPWYSKLLVSFKLLQSLLLWKMKVVNFRNEITQFFETQRKSLEKSNISISDLFSIYEQHDINVTKKWEMPILNDVFCMIFFGLSQKLMNNWAPKHIHLLNEILVGKELESMRPLILLQIVAAEIKKLSASSQKQFSDGSDEESYKILTNDSHFTSALKSFNHFLELYGDRCPNEQKLEAFDYREAPLILMKGLKAYLKVPTQTTTSESPIKNHFSFISELPYFKGKILKLVLMLTRTFVAEREKLRLLRSHSFGLCRKVFRKLGNQLCDIGILQKNNDIYFYTIHELLALRYSSSLGPISYHEIEHRKEKFFFYQQKNSLPERFATYGFPYQAYEFDAMKILSQTVKNPSLLPGQWQGIGCYPGIMKGEVFVAKSLDEALEIKDQILVTYSTDPSWVAVYPLCKAMIIEKGSLLSHSAVIAREMTIPTIVSVSGIVNLLKTGDQVEIDAHTGIIKKL